ncbi:MAG: hypothetical protein ACRDWN_07660, partial [Acidimicrobiales bacterium]
DYHFAPTEYLMPPQPTDRIVPPREHLYVHVPIRRGRSTGGASTGPAEAGAVGGGATAAGPSAPT